MAMAKKLDTFVLRDKFGLKPDTIAQEALASAVRRSEVMGWREVSVRPADATPTSEGEYKCYPFEIWGLAAESKPTDQSSSEKVNSPLDKGAAASEVNP